MDILEVFFSYAINTHNYLYVSLHKHKKINFTETIHCIQKTIQKYIPLQFVHCTVKKIKNTL